MRLFGLLVGLLASTVFVFAQEPPASDVPKEKHAYQSDVTRLRKIVTNSLYSHREIFLRELISNANDALEKLRLTMLTDKSIVLGDDPLNITIKPIPNPDGQKGGRLVITDYGIGMTPSELSTNLGTLAKSGTSEFLSKAESGSLDTTGQGNLIGAFGLGFYSSFLVADQVYVASIPPKSDKHPEPQQYVFSSSADDPAFEVYPDPRGNTLGRGTEITLVLKEDVAEEYLNFYNIGNLVEKHSAFATSFPIYLYSTSTEEVPDVDEAETESASASASTSEAGGSESASASSESDSKETPAADEDEAIVEDATPSSSADDEDEGVPLKMKTVIHEDWVHLNRQPPIWTRDAKDVSDEEYQNFYKATFKDQRDPLAWTHFSGDAGTGTAFKAILYIPSTLPLDFWSGQTVEVKDVRIHNKRVLITNDLGEDALPKWMSWLKAIVDAEDLPLNVSRETLQSSRFLKQIKQFLTRRLIQLIQRIAKDDPDKYNTLFGALGSSIKLGAVEAEGNKQKLAALCRFASNQMGDEGRNGSMTSLDEYVKNKKKGQTQVFFLAGMGQTVEMLASSLFVEKLTARGYEVLLVNEPLDEIMFTQLRTWEKLTFQDVTKSGLKFGDEDEDPETEKEEQARLAEKFQPLMEWLKNQTQGVITDVTISNRLVTSPCAIVTPEYGYSANMERLLNAQNSRQNTHEWMRGKRLMEINPHSPLIEGMLRRVQQLPDVAAGEEPDLEAEAELKEVVAILVDGALVRSGFDVPDVNMFFTRVDRVLRRSLGVSESAKAADTVRPAPPVDPEPLPDTPEEERPKASIELPEHLEGKLQVDMEEMPDEPEEVFHDEL